MKWLLLIATVGCLVLTVWADKSAELKPTRPDAALEPAAQAEERDSKTQHKRGILDLAAHIGNHKAKSQHKRGFLSPVPSYAHGHDIPTIRHSILKPFIVNYPVQSIPIGIKIPLRNPGLIHLKYPVIPANKIPLHQSSGNHPHSVNAGWSQNCGHGQAVQPAVFQVPNKPIVPTSSANIPVNIVPTPAVTAVLPLPRPPVPFLRPLLPIHPPVFGPVPFTPIVPASNHFVPAPAPAPVFHPAPVPVFNPAATPVFHPAPVAIPIPAPIPAPLAPAVLRPGNSLHTSYFATYPRYPFVNSLPILRPQIPVVGHHIAPAIVPAIAPAHFPLNVGRIPVARPPLVFNQIPGPVNFPVNIGNIPLNFGHTSGAGIFPAQGTGQPPLFLRPGEQLPPQAFLPGGSAQTPLSTGQTPLFSQRPGELFPPQFFVPAAGGQTPLGTGQPPLFGQQPGENFPPQAFTPEGTGQTPLSTGQTPSQFIPPQPFAPAGSAETPISPSQPPLFLPRPDENFTPQGFGPALIPGSQDQGPTQNPHDVNNNVWIPMANPTPENAFPTNQYPSQFNPQGETPQDQPQDVNPAELPNDHNQGYVYPRGKYNQAFQDGKEIEQNLQQQAQEQFLKAQQFFSQQQQQPERQQQESGNQDESQQQQQAQQQYLQEQQQQYYNQQQGQDSEIQQQQLQEAELQQHSYQQFSEGQQQFISAQQQAAANPQHEPQLPQTLPSHPLSGRPINQAFHVNHSQRQRKRRPSKNQENQY